MRAVLILIVLGTVLTGCLSGDEGASPSESNSQASSGNSAPVINGNPADQIVINDQYSFEPNASDPDGDTLTFSVQNRPGWATFDSGTGALTGRPTLGDIGQYSNIRISASDGDKSASLAFTIDVVQSADGSVTLSWTAPTQNEDGTALTNLAGYRIYYGTSSGNYTAEIEIDNPGLTTYVVDQLVADTYYFAATAYNSNNVESDFSAEAVRIVN